MDEHRGKLQNGGWGKVGESSIKNKIKPSQTEVAGRK